MSDAESRALRSLLDVVEELAQGLAARQVPDGEWARVVSETFELHRAELRGETVIWPDELPR